MLISFYIKYMECMSILACNAFYFATGYIRSCRSSTSSLDHGSADENNSVKRGPDESLVKAHPPPNCRNLGRNRKLGNGSLIVMPVFIHLYMILQLTLA